MSRPPLDFWYKQDQHNNITNWLDSYLKKNYIPHATYMTNRWSNTTNEVSNTTIRLIKVKRKSARTNRPGVRLIIVRIITKRIWFIEWYKFTVKRTKINAIRRKNVGNTRNRTLQTHRQAILIRLTTVTTDVSDVKIRAIRKRIL